LFSSSDDSGEVHRVDGFDIDDPKASDCIPDSTDTGEPFSWSEPDEDETGAIFGCPVTAFAPLDEFADLRGYGCSGFLFGLGGGISIIILAAGSRTTCMMNNPQDYVLDIPMVQINCYRYCFYEKV
jgi:hypothetical protein